MAKYLSPKTNQFGVTRHFSQIWSEPKINMATRILLKFEIVILLSIELISREMCKKNHQPIFFPQCSIIFSVFKELKFILI